MVDRRESTDVCPQVLALSPMERRLLAALGGAGGRPPSAIRCLRPAHHRGRHVSDAMASERIELARFVRWRGSHPKIFDAPYCGRGLYADEWCHLPEGHTGPHTYSYLPLEMRWWYGEDVWLAADDWLHRPDPIEDG